ncbi:MAG: c-type cytochrome [Flavobacteriaceae bacterium]|nr:c-type cytochrome [Flavobacteriaceae bacterium]NVJ73352.1 c-type cytochrome [Flavobacteriaceae bacterium]
MKNLLPWWIRIPALFFIIFAATEWAIDSGEQPAFIAIPMIQLFLGIVLLILIAIEIIVTAVENIMLHSLDEKAKERYMAEKDKLPEFKWLKAIWIFFIGKKKEGVTEETIIIDHDFDGIKELDNNLPPWWIYLFYATIVFAIIYHIRFDFIKKYTQAEEYEMEVAAAEIAIAEYKKTAKDLVDASTVELMTDAADLAAGKQIFDTNCVACHMADGGGGIGPNLTDQHWILGGGIKNVFSTVSEGGRDGKGMVAWKQILKPAEIAQVASYVISLGGTSPANPKEAEGELWEE